jgi:hypothetical protein
VLVDMLTVHEMMMYTAELKLPKAVSLEEKKARVGAMITHLHLTKCRDTRIGHSLDRGISGGEVRCRTHILTPDSDVQWQSERTGSFPPAVIPFSAFQRHILLCKG